MLRVAKELKQKRDRIVRSLKEISKNLSDI
jgi:hypothetical protein